MAGIRGNTAWLMGMKQAGRGVVPTVALPGAAAPGAYKFPFSAGSIQPERVVDNLTETDASRDRGVAFVRSGGVAGSPEVYVRDAGIGFLLNGALGSDAPTGAAPNIVHTITPANVLPYLTFWRDLGDVLFEQYNDCLIDTLTIRAGAGDPLSAAVGIMGLSANRLPADPSVAPVVVPLQSGYVYNYNDATVTLAGGATALVSSFEVAISNNAARQQTDDFRYYDVVANMREVSLSFDLIFETLAEYNKFNYGSATGTAQSSSLYTTSADFQFDNGPNNQIKFTFPSIAYEQFPIAPNVGGGPVVTSIRAVAQRGGSPVLTATVKNSESVY